VLLAIGSLADEGGRGRTADEWKEAASRAMDRYARGDDGACSELYDLLAPRLYSFLVRRVRDRAFAEDLLQQTFLQMHLARRHFARGANVMPWAFAIARRLFIDWLRKQGREVLAEEAAEPIAPDALPETLVGQRRLTQKVREALARMPDAHREAFELIQRDGLSMAEAAEVLGTTVTAVKLRAHRAYETLRELLGDAVREELGVVP
jgi:RNA polymerase sigma-70 factor (ECF subfamily)